MKKIFAAVFGLLFFIAATCSAYTDAGKLKVTMLDVDQGDAFLIETPEQNILIDTGDVSARSKLLTQLNTAGITRFEKIILTHPHADHIGNAKAVIDAFPVDLVIDNGKASNSPLYNNYVSTGIARQAAVSGDVLDFGSGVKFYVFLPDANSTLQGVNNQSIVGKLTFGDFSILFTGDIEKDAEKFLWRNSNINLESTILKAAHHGSKTSNVDNFVGHVKPKFVFISAGLNNKFGHPHKAALRTFREYYVTDENIFCTAFNGQVTVETDGSNYLVIPEKFSDWVVDYTKEIVTVTRIS